MCYIANYKLVLKCFKFHKLFIYNSLPHNMTQELFSHAATVWPVKDMEASLSFYRDLLGFEVTFTWEEPITYAVLKRGNISINLVVRDDMPSDYQPLASLYIFVHDLDALWEEFTSKGAKVINPIGNRDYGMRDFDLEDPSGYKIVIGKGLNTQ